MPMSPSSGGHHTIRSQGPLDREILRSQTELSADDLGADQERGKSADRTEDAEGDGLGLDGPLGLGHDASRRFDLELDQSFVHRPLDLTLNDGGVGRSAVDLHARLGEVGAAAEQRSGQGRGEGRHVGIAGHVGVILDHLVAAHDDPHQRHLHHTERRDLRGSEPREIGLSVGVHAERHALAQVGPEHLGCVGAHHHLVPAGGVEEPTLGDRDPVEVDAVAPHDADAFGRLRGKSRRAHRIAVPTEQQRVEPDRRPDPGHVGQVGDSAEDRGVVAGAEAAATRVVEGGDPVEVRRVGAPDEGRE